MSKLVVHVLAKLEKGNSSLAITIPSTKFYRGTTTIDRLDSKYKFSFAFRQKKLIGFIVNTIHSRDGAHTVGHWVSLTCQYSPQKNQVTVRYFDSFASKISKYTPIKQYINNIKNYCHKHSIIFRRDVMSRGIQYHNSKLCGVYAAYFICKAYEKKNEETLAKIFSKFGSNKIKNDVRVYKYLVKNYPSPYCHDNPIYSQMKVSLKRLRQDFVAPPLCPRKTLGLDKCFDKCQCRDCRRAKDI